MEWLWAIIVGFVLGLIARAILPGKQHQPIWLTTLFGIVGALLGNAVSRWIGVEDTKGIDWIRHLLQLAGAVLIVGLGEMAYMAVRGNKRTA
ncbi:GlsB/YeaQ/YmgE family stress response membrane protein [Streptomyces goshikiensis]|uniref:GlsB/YeaQ/YmgE family stress response membrane protein n=1 Tax=Streptomyces goshikiensis TaxID=1942 RepID=A0ABZ1RQT4_9ACTN|nr:MULTISPECIES: GlsB/YeaQ/YmgE family stress response membrane protein [Streptomyces]MBP0933647.1 GlsB/YeaQ/YmgE family stress response membrane protein [Streptomyces sp. KCTC 0041BP]OKI27303.1 signal peptidase [Streptomyces sp. CB03578]PJN14879.1 GlsB/YeaQ/YmgE family stress response membrane protein [Streptomyces sp. CB02120-2]GHD68569.1 signal peptidase [Streptomyces goshikiensis]